MIDRQEVEALLREFSRTEIDRQTLSQTRLDLTTRTRASFFRWRGQFSPELIEFLLQTFAGNRSSVLDPFTGSGTTLIECGRKGISAHGIDVNPAAVYQARTAELMTLPRPARAELFERLRTQIARQLEPDTWDLFTTGITVPSTSIEDRLVSFLATLKGERLDQHDRTVLVNTLMLAMGDQRSLGAYQISKAFATYAGMVLSLPVCEAPISVAERDARETMLDGGGVDLVLTSPPYINVFNYHQNYRPAMELLGHVPLEAARSEIGANRKHRGNRFFTVVQYCLDMLQALREMRRVIAPDGLAVIVVGRESNVRGCSFQNSSALFCLAIGAAGFRLRSRHERVFVSRFGTRVYEDLLVLLPEAGARVRDEQFARAVGDGLLSAALERTAGDIRHDILDALDDSQIIEPSPLLKQASYTQVS